MKTIVALTVFAAFAWLPSSALADPNWHAGDHPNWHAFKDRPRHSVPEPATLLLLGTGLVGVGWLARRKRK